MPQTNSALSLPGAYQLKRIPVFKPLKPKQLRFISGLLRNSLNVEQTARALKCDWRIHYIWLNKPDYKQAIEYAKDLIGDILESAMLGDAIEGHKSDIIYKGRVTGNYREVFSAERITLLKGLRPQYREGFSMNSVGPVALAISYPGQAQTPNNSLNKLGDDLEEAKIINPSK